MCIDISYGAIAFFFAAIVIDYLTKLSWILQNVYILVSSKKMLKKQESKRAEELLEIMMEEVKPRQEALSSHGYILYIYV